MRARLAVLRELVLACRRHLWSLTGGLLKGQAQAQAQAQAAMPVRQAAGATAAFIGTQCSHSASCHTTAHLLQRLRLDC